MHRPEELSGRYKVHVPIHDAHKAKGVDTYFCQSFLLPRNYQLSSVGRARYPGCELQRVLG